MNLFKASQVPFMIPKRSIERRAYEEQEGVKRQQGPRRIEKVS